MDDLFAALKKDKEVKNEKTVCCSEPKLVTENEKIICKACGTINDHIYDCNAEWRFYGNDDSKSSDPTRCGMPTNELLPQSSYGSTISYKYGESYEMKRIRNYHSWHAMPYKERSLYNVFDSLTSTSKLNGITPCIIQEAKILYKKISEHKISRGSNRKGIIASCIYKACKIKNVPRSHKEIASIFKIDITHMTRGCKRFDEIINEQNSEEDKIISNMTGSQSIDFINRFCSKLNIGQDIIAICIHVCNKAEEFSLVSENTPPSIAAGSIFLVCSLLGIEIIKRKISDICNISEVTISKCYKKLLKYHEHLFPKEIMKKLYN
jgi:transcription initiation factor TFIIB